MTQTRLEKILTRRYDVGREIKFILYADELLSDPIDLTEYTVVITVIKPDNNFVIENFVGDTVTITDQMEVVTGTGYYCVHVTKDNETIYTGQGEFIIDDVLISDDELESISEVNGLRFPDDFLTIDSPVAVIDDTVVTNNKAWSSSRIINAIGTAIEEFHDRVIDDEAITPQATWSSDKLYAMFNNIHTYSCTKLWDAGFTPSPGVWLEYDFGEDLENYDALVFEFVVDGWEGDSDTVTIYPKMQHLNTTRCYHYVKGSDYALNIFHVSGTIYGLGAGSGYYPPQYKAVYGIKY